MTYPNPPGPPEPLPPPADPAPYGYPPGQWEPLPPPAYGYPPPHAAQLPTYPPPYPYGYQPPRPTEGLAIASLVLSCAAVPAMCGYGVGGALGLVGAILGHVARSRIKRTGADGAGLALAGIIMGWLTTAITAAVVVFIVVAFLADDVIHS